jgi:hypothetical protein
VEDGRDIRSWCENDCFPSSIEWEFWNPGRSRACCCGEGPKCSMGPARYRDASVDAVIAVYLNNWACVSERTRFRFAFEY